ncbi:MAG: KUP/HAK/KT family potassium transporter [Bacteroidia bacterium]|nr:KUP/HAK/KT family potassium transporter [Bacteroidia bacterium]
MSSHDNQKVSLAGLLITLGIIFGDIGTSPLYVIKAIVDKAIITEGLIFGAISCVFWTLTLQTTIKYVIITLRADNNGEGGIFSLYTLVRRRGKWLIWPAIIGGATLLADGVITPAISVTSAVEGLLIIYPDIPVVEIVVVIISILFFFQQFGTSAMGRSFGPIMLVWFTMLAILGISQIIHMPGVLAALSPHYAIGFLTTHPGAFWLLGGVFLCTTGAEALYSDLGHCGRQNIRVSWIYVKTALVLNYLGQGAWLMQYVGEELPGNPFYKIMPGWFLGIGIVIATAATIIASQALISGSFTLVGEAIRLYLFPRVKIIYPTDLKGQLYIPLINFLLWLGCIGIVFYFKDSSHMEAAYGLSITVTMLMTTLLLGSYLRSQRLPRVATWLLIGLYLMIEGAFFVANIVKFTHGGYVAAIIALAIVLLMYIWLRAHEIKRRLAENVDIQDYTTQLVGLSQDTSVPKYATHLIFLSTAEKKEQVEHKAMYSILQKQPKRADIYWFIHIQVTDDPATMAYQVLPIVPGEVIKVVFKLGFRVEQRVNLFLRMVIEDMVKRGEIDIISKYNSLRDMNIVGDFRFVILEEFLSSENDLPILDQFVMSSYIFIKSFTASPERWFGLDTSVVVTEKVPLLIKPVSGISMQRIEPV